MIKLGGLGLGTLALTRKKPTWPAHYNALNGRRIILQSADQAVTLDSQPNTPLAIAPG